jgi:hypothetical protein
MITPLVVVTLLMRSNSVSGAGPSNSRAPLPSRVIHIVTVIERMDLFPSVPRAALPRPCHLLHGRPAAKSTPARGAIGGSDLGGR